MPPEVAKKLLPLVNTKKTTDALELYMEERVKDALKTLEQSVMCAEEMKREDDTISCYEVLLNNETVANG